MHKMTRRSLAKQGSIDGHPASPFFNSPSRANTHSQQPAAMLVLPPVSMTLVAQVVTAVLTIALTGVLVAIGSSIRSKMRGAKLLAPVAGPNGRFLLGLLPEMTENLHRFFDYEMDLFKEYGERVVMPWNLLNPNMLYVSDPKDVEHMLSGNLKNYIKSDHMIACVGEVFGKSLLALNHAHTADGGAMFRLQRKITTRIFTTSNFKAFTEGIFQQYALVLVDKIAANDGKCEMHTVASQYTLQTIFDIVCGVSLASIDEDLGLQFVESMDIVFDSIMVRAVFKPYFKYLWWCMPSEYRIRRESKVMLDLVDGIIRKRLLETEAQIVPRLDLLSLFVKRARELEAEGANALDLPTLRSVVTSSVFAGRDTTSSSILYSFYSLAQYPEQQDKILDELKSVDATKLTFEDVKKLKYLDAFVWETLRLYPTAPGNSKQAAEDDYLPDGTFVPAGTEVLYSSYYMGRSNAKLWGDDLLVFRPERWLEMKTRPTAYEFPLFQGGPRICPGMNMALLQTKMFIAILLQKFHVQIQDGEQVQDRPYVFGASLVMKDGLPLQLTPRVTPSN